MSVVAMPSYKERSSSDFSKIVSAITIDDPKEPGSLVVPGFEDVTGTEFIGSGRFYNTFSVIFQLGAALTLSETPTISSIKTLPRQQDPPFALETIERLRAEKPLDGARLVDLGCGKPVFAATAVALGATVFTADLETMSEQQHTALVQNHSVVDLCDPDAAEVILEKTKGPVDFVTENIIDLLPRQISTLKRPELEDILRIGDALLTTGGVLTSYSYSALPMAGYERL